jgi:hypothetical protein
MNPKHILYSIFVVILLHSCKPRDKSLYEFDPRSLDENEITLFQIADDISYTPLDNSIQLGEIYDFHYPKFINNSIFLYENKVGVLVFNRNGKFLRKIGSKGRGPGEYIYGLDFTVDKKTETVYINDLTEIKTYNKEGKFLRSFSLKQFGDMINTIEFFNSKLFVFYAIQNENTPYEWIVFDTIGNVITKEKRRIPQFTSNVGGGEGAYYFNNKIGFWNQYSDTIFLISDDFRRTPSFIISPGDHRFPKSRINAPTELSNHMSLRQIFETHHFLAVRYIFNEVNYFALIDKESNRIFLFNWEFDGSGGILNDLDGGTRFLPKAYYTEDDREYIIGFLYPYQLKDLISSNDFKNSSPKYPEKKKELEKLANSLKETDNPVLMIVRMKK